MICKIDAIYWPTIATDTQDTLSWFNNMPADKNN